MSKIINLTDFAALIKSKSKIGIGGFDLHRKPIELVLQICESEAEDLELFGISLALEADLLIGSGKVGRIISSYTGLENFGQCYFFRDACEREEIESVELSTYATILALQAGALGIEYIPSKTMLHSDMAKSNNLIRIINSPFSDNVYAAIKSYNPDISLIHVGEADRKGNAYIYHPPATKVDELLAKASKTSIISTEKLVDKIENPTISGIYISHILHLPGGSAQTSHYPLCDVDSKTMELYSKGSKEKNLSFCKEVIKNAIERRRKN